MFLLGYKCNHTLILTILIHEALHFIQYILATERRGKMKNINDSEYINFIIENHQTLKLTLN